jgi:hypothetical protein
MAATTRQTNLLIQQDWTKVYQSFQNADFQSYDFETLRKSMIDYLRTYYPEDFNDFIESSEYVALIDLIAFLGQSLAFRTDLNARENFLDTAERRDSVLKLARLVSYVPKRTTAASGVLRIDSVSTTEALVDSNDMSLTNTQIFWNDASNENWLEQMSIIFNASFIDTEIVGKPGNSQKVGLLTVDEYSVNIINTVVPTYTYSSTVEGLQMGFEVVSPTTLGKTYIYEKDPQPLGVFNILYQNDNLGNGSTNTGWFLYFKQGALTTLDFTLDQQLPNRTVSVNVDNINNNDVWLYQLDNNGNYQKLWTKVENVSGTNVIYNQNNAVVRTLYQVNSRTNDQIDLVFGDGAFSEIPSGRFRLYYRVSNGLQYRIAPSEMKNIVVPITYVSRTNRTETLTIRASLYSAVDNASTREAIADIKQKAPQQYYTQDRMITGEDYNVLPFTKFNSVLKIKSTNRSSSGISRYLDVIDVTGKYSSTNIFADDGLLYSKETVDSLAFIPQASGDVVGQLNDVVNNQLLGTTGQYVPFTQFVYQKFRRFTTRDTDVNGSLFDCAWQKMTLSTNQSTGFFTLSSTYLFSINSLTGMQDTGVLATPALKVGTASSNALRFVVPGAIIKFRASVSNSIDPHYFNSLGQIMPGYPSNTGDSIYLYATVTNISGDGTGTDTNTGILTSASVGPITLSTFVPSGAYIDQIIPKIHNVIPTTLLTSAVTLVNGKKNFGLRYDEVNQTWNLIQPQNLKISQDTSPIINAAGVNAQYSESYAGNTTSASLDSSWVMAFVSGTYGYNIYYRQLNYIFESIRETNFYYDASVRVYDPKSATIISDYIKVLRSNSIPDSNTAFYQDKQWSVYKMIVDPDGYQNTNKILLKFADTNRDGIPDNPDLFNEIVNPANNTGYSKYLFFQQTYNANNYVQYVPMAARVINTQYASQGEIVQAYAQFSNGQIFYAYTENVFYTLSVTYLRGVATRSLSSSPNGSQYLWLVGRSGLYFQYRHAAPADRRIDPSPNNIVDLYILTKQYYDAYQKWIKDTTKVVIQPQQDNVESLQLAYGSLENFKTISDTLIYNPANFKPIFGKKSDISLQATFKVVKNSQQVISDNDVKTAVIAAINTYFDINNWDFGESFYFSELSAYLHTKLSTKISSIIIVPTSTSLTFGSLYQINANPNEIITSCATVDDVQIIAAITQAQL